MTTATTDEATEAEVGEPVRIAMAREGSMFFEPETGISISWGYGGRREVMDVPAEAMTRRLERRITEGHVVKVPQLTPNVTYEPPVTDRDVLIGEEAAKRMAEPPPEGGIRFEAYSRFSPRQQVRKVDREEKPVPLIENPLRPEEEKASDADVAGVEERREAVAEHVQQHADEQAQAAAAAEGAAPAAEASEGEEGDTRTVVQLRDRAKELELTGYSHLNREDLLAVIQEAEAAQAGDTGTTSTVEAGAAGEPNQSPGAGAPDGTTVQSGSEGEQQS